MLDNNETLSKITGCKPKEFQAARPALMTYFKIVDGEWVQPEIDADIEKGMDISRKRQVAGRKGGKARVANLMEIK